MYAIQQQALGSIQWIIIASGLKETTYTITTLSKGVRYAFRVLTITSKAFSKPSPATDPVQLLDRGSLRILEHPFIHRCEFEGLLNITCVTFFSFFLRSLHTRGTCDY